MTESDGGYPKRGQLNEFGRTPMEEVEYRYKLFKPNNLGRMAATFLTGGINPHNLSRENRIAIGRLVARLINDFGNVLEAVSAASQINDELARGNADEER